MAQIDSSIYLQNKGADVFGEYSSGYEKGLSMRDMLNERDKKNKIAEAYKGATTQNPDGSISFDSKKVAGNLFGAGFVKEASDAQEKSQQNEMAKKKQMRDENAYKVSEVGRLAGSALQNPNAWSQIRQEAIKSGYGTEETLPQNYDEKFLRGIHSQALSVSDQWAQQNKDKEFKLKEQELGIKRIEAGDKNKRNSGALEGRKALDKDYAKDYNDWTTNSRNAAIKNLDRLKEAKEALKNDPSLTGAIVGNTPDWMRNLTNEAAILNRDKVRAAAQGALKATLGSAFTENEGKRIMEQSYNERLSPQANIDLIDKAIKEIEGNISNSDTKASYFQKSGTLDGLDIVNQPMQVAGGLNSRPVANKSGMVKVITPNGAVKNVPENRLQDVLNAGGKVAPKTAGY